MRLVGRSRSIYESNVKAYLLTGSAGAGSLLLEFTTLSRLTGDPRFEDAAAEAFFAIWNRRSELGLIGNGIDLVSGVRTPRGL